MSSIPRMRTVQQCAAYLKEHDPDCCVGEWYIRKLVKRGEIPVRRSGKRMLVNLDTLLEYLAGEQLAPKMESNIT